MALYLSYDRNKLVKSPYFSGDKQVPNQWHIDEPTTTLGDLILLAPCISAIQADGHELAYIKMRVPSAPLPVGLSREQRLELPSKSPLRLMGRYPNEVQWFGDWAQFIVANL